MLKKKQVNDSQKVIHPHSQRRRNEIQMFFLFCSWYYICLDNNILYLFISKEFEFSQALH